MGGREVKMESGASRASRTEEAGSPHLTEAPTLYKRPARLRKLNLGSAWPTEDDDAAPTS